MTFEEIKQVIIAHFGENTVIGTEESGLQPALEINRSNIADVCLFLRDHADLYFDFLSCISAVDYGIETNAFGIIYHLASIPYKRQLTLKVRIENDRSLSALPHVPSVCHVWRTADWHEREAYDLMGIYFEGHPDLRRILLPEDWEGYPLRKDYQAAEYYHGIAID